VLLNVNPAPRHFSPVPVTPGLPRLSVPRTGVYQDGTLGPAESVEVPFTICLTQPVPFQFFVDVVGRQLEGVQ
jgi:hypothetical protein